MAASITQVRRGLADRLATIDGLRTYATVPGTVTAPAAIIEPDEPVIEYGATMANGSHDLYFTALVLVQEGTLRTAQEQLDDYLDADGEVSIRAAIESDETLGGLVSFAAVRRASGYGTYTFNGIEYPGVKFRIEVTT